MKRLLRSFKSITFCAVFLAILPSLFLTAKAADQNQSQVYEAIVKKVVVSGKVNSVTKVKIKQTTVQITSGPLKGRSFTINDNLIPTTHEVPYKTGDSVIITYSKSPVGEVVYITDVARQVPLTILLIIFVILTVAIGRWQGLTSLIGMCISFVIIGRFIVPNILLGNDPLIITLFGAVFIIPITYYISHGFNKKTSIAIISTFITLILTGLFSYAFVEFAKLSGFNTEEAAYLQNLGIEINIKSILLSGIVIGILAVLNDITVSQASVVNTLYSAKPSLSVKDLYFSAMRVGNDHIASLVNTLVLVYAGASLPLFVLLENAKGPLSLVVNQEVIATEIIRTLISSIGIIAAVPLTTYLASVAYKKNLL